MANQSPTFAITGPCVSILFSEDDRGDTFPASARDTKLSLTVNGLVDTVLREFPSAASQNISSFGIRRQSTSV